LAALLAVALASAGGAAARATPDASLQRVGRVPALPAGASRLGPLAGSLTMHATVTLRPRDAAALAAFATAVSTPTSPEYRHFLSVRAFARRFGAGAAQVAAVRSALRARGLDPGRLSANGLSIPLRASASTLERAFQTRLERVRLSGGEQVVMSTLAPALSARVAGLVQAVVGLQGAAALRPLRAAATGLGGSSLAAAPHVARAGPQPCSAASAAAGSQGGYTAPQIASAYGFGGLYAAGDEGQGQTIALFELEPFSSSDIAAFAACYGISPDLYEASVDGGAGSGPGSGEAALDIEQALVMAPRARVIVYEGPNSSANGPGSGPYDVLSAIVTQDLAQVVSTSWGQCEALEGKANASSEQTLLEEAAAQGQTVLAATGDSGSEDCDTQTAVPDTSLAVDDPGSQPYVTSVGGTTLAGIGPPPSESVWNAGGNLSGFLGLAAGAGGGGISAFWPMPTWQRAAPASLHVVGSYSSGAPCGAGAALCREVPDVSADADPDTGYEIYYNGSGTAGGGAPVGWNATGGTSAASPLWAALVALADASKSCGGVPLGFLNPALYKAAAGDYGAYFHDITSGNNDFTASHGGLYPAGVGYDMASGLGTPNATPLAGALCAAALRPRNPGTRVSTVRGEVRLRLRASDAAGVHVGYEASGLPPGLKLNGSSGVISGHPRRKGSYRVNALALDARGAAHGFSFTWRILAAPHVSRVALRGLAAGRPSLWLTLTAVAGAPKLRAVLVRLPAGLRFSGRPRALSLRGTGGRPLRYHGRVARGALDVSLRAASGRIALRVSGPFLAGRSSAGKLRLTVTDARGESTVLTVRP
jgi:subtilase family serine protease